jgi:hypothetical protein
MPAVPAKRKVALYVEFAAVVNEQIGVVNIQVLVRRPT